MRLELREKLWNEGWFFNPSNPDPAAASRRRCSRGRRPFECAERVGFALGEREAAGEIVMRGGVVRLQAHEPAVHAQSLGDAAGFGVEAAENFNDIHVPRVAAVDGLEKSYFELRIGFFWQEDMVSLRFLQAPVWRRALQRALTWRRCETGVRPSFDDTVLPYHSMNGALISKILAVEADDLRLLRGVVAVGHVVFFAGADVHLAQQRAFGHDGQRAVNRRAGDRVVDGAGVVEQLLGGEMLLSA